MEGFATGFNLEGKTKPGYYVENENFKLTFSGVMCDERKNIVSHGFECCYDWSFLMNEILASTEDYESRDDVEEKVEKLLKTWLTSFQGWGLLSSMLPTEKHRYFLVSLAYASAYWNEGTGGPYSSQKIFDTVKYVYEHSPGKEIYHLVPPLGAWFEEIVEDENEMVESKGERSKSFTIFFNAKWVLEIKFILEKKKVNKCLVDIAAEKVASTLIDADDVEDLEIPITLFEKVYDKFKDVEWVRSYWNYKAELEANRSDIDVSELAEISEFDENHHIDTDYVAEVIQRHAVLENSSNHAEVISDPIIDSNESTEDNITASSETQSCNSAPIVENGFVSWLGALCIPLVILAYFCF